MLSSGAMSDQEVLRDRAGKCSAPASSARMSAATTLPWLLAENADFGISAEMAESPSTYTSLTLAEANVSGLTGHQSPSVQPALKAISPAFCGGMILATSALRLVPDLVKTSFVAGSTRTTWK